MWGKQNLRSLERADAGVFNDVVVVADQYRHAAAVRALSNKWAKILWAVLQSGTRYDEARHLARLQSKGVVWAKDLPGGVAA